MGAHIHPYGEVQGKHFTLMDLPAHDEQIEPSANFAASFNHEL